MGLIRCCPFLTLCLMFSLVSTPPGRTACASGQRLAYADTVMLLLYVMIKDGFILFLLPWCYFRLTILLDEGLKRKNKHTMLDILDHNLSLLISTQFMTLAKTSWAVSHGEISGADTTLTGLKAMFTNTAGYTTVVNNKVIVLPPFPLRWQNRPPLSVQCHDWSLSIAPGQTIHNQSQTKHNESSIHLTTLDLKI